MTGEVKQTLNTSLDCTLIQHYQIDLIHMAQISDVNNHKISVWAYPTSNFPAI